VQESLTFMLEVTADFASDETEAAIDQAVIQLTDNLENGGHDRAGDKALLMTLVLSSKLMTIAAADNQVSSTPSASLPAQGTGVAAADSEVISTRTTIVVRLQHLEESVGIDEGSTTDAQPKPTILNRISNLEESVLGKVRADPILDRISRLETEIHGVESVSHPRDM
jgi:hypothetical protein